MNTISNFNYFDRNVLNPSFISRQTLRSEFDSTLGGAECLGPSRGMKRQRAASLGELRLIHVCRVSRRDETKDKEHARL